MDAITCLTGFVIVVIITAVLVAARLAARAVLITADDLSGRGEQARWSEYGQYAAAHRVALDRWEATDDHEQYKADCLAIQQLWPREAAIDARYERRKER